MAIFPLAPDQTIAQMWSNGARGGLFSSHLAYRDTTSYPSEVSRVTRVVAADYRGLHGNGDGGNTAVTAENPQ